MSWRNLIWIVIVLSLAGLALFLAHRRPVHPSPGDPAARDLAEAIRAYKLIRQRSYTGLGPDEACRGAIDGMVRQVDEFSAYIPSGKVAPFKHRVTGALVETGLRIATEDSRLMVVGALPDSPAHKAGLFGPLEILAIDDVEAAYLTEAQARKILQSPENRQITLRLRTDDSREIIRRLTPGQFEAETVTGIVRDRTGRWRHLLDEEAGIFYIRISEFVRRTPGELQDVYRRLKAPGGLVLDLRDNPGGTLPTAVEVADRFLAEGLIVRTVGRREQHTHYAHADGTYPPIPLVVLINARTTSAAEIVAGALQVHGRAVLLGQESYGKWSVQSTFDLGGGLGKIHLTTAEYFLADPAPTGSTRLATSRPARRSATAVTRPARKRPGLRPDVPVRLTTAATRRLALLRLQAIVAVPSGLTQGSRPVRLKRSILAADAQLARALQLLRVLSRPTTRPAASAGSEPRP